MAATLVEFKTSELNQLPAELWSFTQQYPWAFDAYFDFLENRPEQSGDSYEIYFDDETSPAIAWTGTLLEEAYEYQGQELTMISIFRGQTMIYFQAVGHLLLDDRKEDFPTLKFLT
jgi:hypothetical protein